MRNYIRGAAFRFDMAGIEKLDIEIQTLTPIWTGDSSRLMDRIHETGILGSMRWWYEAIVRGLGGKACDPSTSKCVYDSEKYKKSNAQTERERLREAKLCDACQLFGATGWRRQFTLAVHDDKTQPIWTPPENLLNIRPQYRNRGWYLPPGRKGKFTLRLKGTEDSLSKIASLLIFLERFGNIGAKPQLGYGIFKIENKEKVIEYAKKFQWDSLIDSTSSNSRQPSITQFMFFSYKFTPEKPGWWTKLDGVGRVATRVEPLVEQFGIVPAAPSLKNDWRFHHYGYSWSKNYFIFGTSRPERRRSRIAVSWAFRSDHEWEIRGWAWMPNRRDDIDKLWEILTDLSNWNGVVNVTGKLEINPDKVMWQRWRSDEILQLLEGQVS